MMNSPAWRRVFACALGALLSLLCLPSTPRAQSFTDGAIGGVVLDQSRAVVPGATITARNVATNAMAEAVSDETGHFSVIHLQPGVYSVAVTLVGFGMYQRDSVTVEVGRTTSLDVSLGVAGQTETVE